jgi:hypothetical protein
VQIGRSRYLYCSDSGVNGRCCCLEATYQRPAAAQHKTVRFRELGFMQVIVVDQYKLNYMSAPLPCTAPVPLSSLRTSLVSFETHTSGPFVTRTFPLEYSLALCTLPVRGSMLFKGTHISPSHVSVLLKFRQNSHGNNVVIVKQNHSRYLSSVTVHYGRSFTSLISDRPDDPNLALQWQWLREVFPVISSGTSVPRIINHLAWLSWDDVTPRWPLNSYMTEDSRLGKGLT